MNKRFIYRFLLLLLALALGAMLANAQAPTQLRDVRIYRGNPYQVPVIDLALTDSATYTATLYYSKVGAPLPAGLQPTVVKTPGLLEVRVSNTNPLPALCWLEIKANGVTRTVANVITDKVVNVRPSGYPAVSYLMPDEPYVSLWKSLIAFYN